MVVSATQPTTLTAAIVAAAAHATAVGVGLARDARREAVRAQVHQAALRLHIVLRAEPLRARRGHDQGIVATPRNASPMT